MTESEYKVNLAEIGVQLQSKNINHYKAIAKAMAYPDILLKIRKEVEQMSFDWVSVQTVLAAIDRHMKEVENDT